MPDQIRLGDRSELLEVVLTAHSARVKGEERFLVGLAGGPAAGKSTLADWLIAALNERLGPGVAAGFPMDGFHMKQAKLEALGLAHRKGGVETFEAAAYCAMLGRLKRGDAPVHVPHFSREIDDVVDDAETIAAQRIVVSEGNYLFLDAPPWRAARALFDVTVALRSDWPVSRERLMARHLAGGSSRQEAEAKIARTDRPNDAEIAATLGYATYAL